MVIMSFLLSFVKEAAYDRWVFFTNHVLMTDYISWKKGQKSLFVYGFLKLFFF